MCNKMKAVWVTTVLGLVACANCQPTSLVPQSNGADEETELHKVGLMQGTTLLDEMLKQGTQLIDEMLTQSTQLIDEVLRLSQATNQTSLAHGLGVLSRQGRRLMHQEGRQTAGVAALAVSLGDLFRPAITALIGSLSMNLATSFTNAITAALGGRSLDIIPPETFMTTPAGRMIPVEQPFSKPKYPNSPFQLRLQVVRDQRVRPLGKRQRRHPSISTNTHKLDR